MNYCFDVRRINLRLETFLPNIVQFLIPVRLPVIEPFCTDPRMLYAQGYQDARDRIELSHTFDISLNLIS